MKNAMNSKRIKNMKIKQRLRLGFGISALIIVIISFIGLYGMFDMRGDMSSMFEQRIATLPVISNSLSSLEQMQAITKDAVLNAQNPDAFNNDKTELQSAQKTYEENATSFISGIATASWKDKMENTEKFYDSTYKPEIEQVFQYLQAGRTDEAQTLLADTDKNAQQISDDINSFMTYRVSIAKDSTTQSAQLATNLTIALLILAVGGTVISIIMGVTISRSVSKPLEELEKASKLFAEGNLNAEIHYQSSNELGSLADSLNIVFQNLRNVVKEISTILLGVAKGKCDYEKVRDYQGDFRPISDALNTILDNLNRIFTNVLNSAQQVDSGAKQIADGSQQLAQGATEQASSVEELSATISEISQNIQLNTEEISQVASNMDSTSKEVEQSNTRMQHMLEAMKAIETSSSEIGKIIKVIDNIAFQTNILALNAAVEAARAGEAGKGFAVVAGEVRTLASKSAEAAKQTTTLIGNSADKVKEGVTFSKETAESLASISGKIQEINAAVQKIEQASNAESTSVKQIAQGVDQVSSVVQTNSATAEESASASEELSAQANTLNTEVDWITLRKQDQSPAK